MPKDCATFLSQPGGRADIKLYPTGDVSYTIKYINKVTRASQKTKLNKLIEAKLILHHCKQNNVVKERNCRKQILRIQLHWH